jgi:hypothetical protein
MTIPIGRLLLLASFRPYSIGGKTGIQEEIASRMGKTFCPAILFILLASSFAWGRVDPGGFDGIPWGSEIGGLRGFIPLYEFPGYKVCRRIEDVHRIDGVEVESIRYEFYREKFYAVRIAFRGKKESQSLLEVQRRRFGPEERQSPHIEEHEWTLDPLTILLTYSEGENIGSLEYVFKPIFDQMVLDENCCTR